ncbi:MAG: ATP-binding protein [Candidatus Omnitrophica bacterium]|nr:ATP-binding protein [Candidatus Omnitrophota bacterium]
MINRAIKLPQRQSFFLFGPRQTGKSTLIQETFAKAVWSIDLLLTEVFLKYSKDPSLFRKEAMEKIKKEAVHTIFIDEIQRVPILLNEVQALMDDFDCRFILTGSSARKLKRGGANLLGGRAVERRLFPFIYEEIKDQFQLEEILLCGSLPAVFGKTRQEKIDVLSAYANTYLREEIQSEGLVRNLGGFSRFLDLAASQSGELVSFSAVARECQLPVRTVQSYYEILEDTLIGFRLEPWQKSIRKRMVGHPKLYFFDLGVTNAINRRLTSSLDAMIKGRLFEQFIILETYRKFHYERSEVRIFFWRTNHGAEVDLLIEKHGRIALAVEIKTSKHVTGAHLSGMRAFRQEYSKAPCVVVCLADHAYEIEGVKILPWESYFRRLPEFI